MWKEMFKECISRIALSAVTSVIVSIAAIAAKNGESFLTVFSRLLSRLSMLL